MVIGWDFHHILPWKINHPMLAYLMFDLAEQTFKHRSMQVTMHLCLKRKCD